MTASRDASQRDEKPPVRKRLYYSVDDSYSTNYHNEVDDICKKTGVPKQTINDLILKDIQDKVLPRVRKTARLISPIEEVRLVAQKEVEEERNRANSKATNGAQSEAFVDSEEK